jgi:hypothetical protein
MRRVRSAYVVMHRDDWPLAVYSNRKAAEAHAAAETEAYDEPAVIRYPLGTGFDVFDAQGTMGRYRPKPVGKSKR